MSDIRITHIEGTTAEITAGARASMFFYDTTLKTCGFFKADGITKRYILTLDDRDNFLYPVGNVPMYTGKWVGISSSDLRIIFENAGSVTITNGSLKIAKNLIITDGDYTGLGDAKGRMTFNAAANTVVVDDGDFICANHLTDNGELYTIAKATSYDPDPYGWSSFTTEEALYYTLGKWVYVSFKLVGTSDLTTATMDLPIAAATESTVNDMPYEIDAIDSGSQKTSAMGMITEGSSNVNFYPDWVYGSWTASGTKSVQGNFFYKGA